MNAIKFSFQFDVDRIKQDLQNIAPSFSTIYSDRIQDGQLQGMDLIIPPLSNQYNEDQSTYRSTPELDQSPYLQSILDFFPCDKLIYRVHNLTAKSKIGLHRDTNRGLRSRIVRVHIPVTSTDQVFFFVNGERICMQNGECWLVDVSRIHEVENRGDTDRFQLMIDFELNDWWKKTLIEHGMDMEEKSELQLYTLEELNAMKQNIEGNNNPVSNAISKSIAIELERRRQLL